VELEEPEILNIGTPGCGRGHHYPAVTTSFSLRKWKKLYWIRCWECKLRLGPWITQEMAYSVVKNLNRAPRLDPHRVRTHL
jgi:hypothetical protein